MNSKLYFEQINKDLVFEKLELLKDKSILITGATGLIGSYFTDAIMSANQKFNLNIKVFVLSRNEEHILNRFSSYIDKALFHYIIQDICEEIEILEGIDYIIHAASNASPKLYSSDPVGTISSNFFGMYNVLDLAKRKHSKVVYLSSSEIYGENVEKGKAVNELSKSSIDITNYRACYPVGKIASETLMHCYKKQFNVDFLTIRACHIYGPTLKPDDNRAISDFLNNVIKGENIILKSSGIAKRCYCYVGDLFDAVMTILNNGTLCEVYNFSDENNFISIKDLADIVASNSNSRVVFDFDAKEEGGNKNEFILMSSDKLENTGFKCKYDIETGIKLTLEILREINCKSTSNVLC